MSGGLERLLEDLQEIIRSCHKTESGTPSCAIILPDLQTERLTSELTEFCYVQDELERYKESEIDTPGLSTFRIKQVESLFWRDTRQSQADAVLWRSKLVQVRLVPVSAEDFR